MPFSPVELLLGFGLVILASVILVFMAFRTPRGADRSVNRPVPAGKSLPFSAITADPEFREKDRIRTRIREGRLPSSAGPLVDRKTQATCGTGDALALVRQPSATHEGSAIAVQRIVCQQNGSMELGEQLGYISKELAADLLPRLNDCDRFLATVVGLAEDKEAGPDGDTADLSIEIVEYERVPAAPGQRTP